jgi:hypothetical protein
VVLRELRGLPSTPYESAEAVINTFGGPDDARALESVFVVDEKVLDAAVDRIETTATTGCRCHMK